MIDSKDDIISNRYKKFTPEQKLIESIKLYYLARELKRSALISFHPEIKSEDLEKKISEIFYMQNLNLFSIFTDILQDNNIEYFITGSIVAIIYGEPRLTHDIDLIVNLNNSQVENFTKSFTIDKFYCPPVEVIKTEINRDIRGHFNIIHHKTGFKADIYLIGKEEIQIWAMNNRKEIKFIDKKLFIAPPEYVIIKKLEFYSEGKSEKHLNDIDSIIINSGELLNYNFIDNELNKLGLKSIWDKIRK